MKLNEEIKRSAEGVCTIINEDYVLLNKKMPVKDEELDLYIKKINEANEKKINTPKVVDYELCGEQSEYGYSQGYFLEERAKGVNINELGRSYNNVKISNPDYNPELEENVAKHLNCISEYIEELERRANASQDIYDKFFVDYEKLHNMGLHPDPKPLNFFFEPEIGYTIIDPVWSRGDFNKDMAPTYMSLAIVGYGLPEICIGRDSYVLLDKEKEQKLLNAMAKINDKMSKTCEKNGCPLEAMQNTSKENKKRILGPLEEGTLEKEEALKFIEKKYQAKIEIMQKKEDHPKSR